MKANYGGMEASAAERLKALEEENAKLKKLLSEQMLMLQRFASFFQKNGRAGRPAGEEAKSMTGQRLEVADGSNL